MESIKLETRPGEILLHAHHSSLVFSLEEPGFQLRRRGQLVLRTGNGWGKPSRVLTEWHLNGITAFLRFQSIDATDANLSVTITNDGWHLAWNTATKDTFEIASGVHWYGHGELVNQLWPLEKASLWESPFITWDNGPTGLCCVLEPRWITSTGAAIILDSVTDQTHVGFNAPPSGIVPPGWGMTDNHSPASHRPHPALPGSSGLLTLFDTASPLSYELIAGDNAVDAFHKLTKPLPRPDAIPPHALLEAPIWTTWAEFKTAIDQERVIAFAEDIRKHNYPGATIEIDDQWQREYGDTDLDPHRFPDPADMVQTLNALGFAVTLWVIPFMRDGSSNTTEAVHNGFLVRDTCGNPYSVRWWQGEGYLLDVSNPHALVWWGDKLDALQKRIGLAGFKFDAGEACFLPGDAVTHQPITRNDYGNLWAAYFSKRFPYSEVRCGWRGQRNSCLLRHWDKFSTWGFDNGLSSVITTALSLSMCGYPFLLPDMIGGNAYGEGRPDRELLVRWAQVSAPMLAIQFSIAPWHYDAEIINICRTYAQLHVDLAPLRIAAAHDSVISGKPPIKPLFWLAPDDPEAEVIDDQYLVGETLLVAPVVHPGARERDIYLPPGKWRDYWSKKTYSGGGWLRGFPAPLDTLPLFER